MTWKFGAQLIERQPQYYASPLTTTIRNNLQCKLQWHIRGGIQHTPEQLLSPTLYNWNHTSHVETIHTLQMNGSVTRLMLTPD